MKILKFSGDIGKSNYELLTDGITIGASDNQPKDREKRSSIGRLQRKLFSLSKPSENIDLRFRPLNAKSLKEDGLEIKLTGTELKQIDELLAKVGWSGLQTEPLLDLDDFLGSLPDYDEGVK
jgi:hypothetical protein